MKNVFHVSCVALVSLTLVGAGCGSKSPPSPGDGTDGGSDGGTTLRCGDGALLTDETCDDGNTADADGCSSSCQTEPGWTCATLGSPCTVTLCGDGVAAGGESCDDGNGKSGDGCASTCQVENDGWSCTTPGQACAWTKCGDGTIQAAAQGGPEQCEDGNDLPLDGCYGCQLEPACTNGACTPICGDGIITGSEGCDDANTLSGDGCSSDCTLEPESEGWVCTVTTEDLPDHVDIPVIYRDFLGMGTTSVPAGAATHDDFENHNYNNGPARCLVESDLDPEGKPVFNDRNGYSDAACTSRKSTRSLTDSTSFAQWYRDEQKDGSDLLNKTVVSSLRLAKVDGTYEYDSADSPLGRIPTGSEFKAGFFALDDDPNGWGIFNSSGHDFHFTTQTRYWFTYGGGERLYFSGDDDVWVFINGKLAVDIGGVHSEIEDHITLSLAADGVHDDATKGADDSIRFGEGHFGLAKDGVYQMDLFHAERHTSASNFLLTLGGFVKAKTTCKSVCGDGIKAPDEQCDHGSANGATGDTCDATCKLVAPRPG